MAAKTRVICCYALPSPEFARKVGNRAGLLKGKADRYSAETRLILFEPGPPGASDVTARVKRKMAAAGSNWG